MGTWRARGRAVGFLGVVVTVAFFAGACGSEESDLKSASGVAGMMLPAPLPEDHRVDPMPAADLDETTTGIRGAIAAGLFPGDPEDPYAELRAFEGEIVIDEEWLANENGGRRIVEGFDLDGSIVVATPDVVVRYCRIRGRPDDLYNVQNNGTGDGSGFELAWCEVAFEQSGGKAVLGRNLTVYRSDISGGEDGIHVNDGGASPGPVTIEQSYVHGQYRPEGHHSDGIQFNGDPGGPIRVVGNKVINHYQDANAPLMLSGVEEILVEENYLWGGVYFMVGGVEGTLTSRDNLFAWGSTAFGAYGVTRGELDLEGDRWAEWIDPEAIDAEGQAIEPPSMPEPDVELGSVVEPGT